MYGLLSIISQNVVHPLNCLGDPIHALAIYSRLIARIGRIGIGVVFDLI